MKVLLAISSWPFAAMNGDHQASRDTWLRQAFGRDLIDYRFFMGDGKPAPVNEALDQHWAERLPHYADKPGASAPVAYAPQADEVMLPVPWDFKHLALKVREMVHWAHVQGYDYVFKCDTDTYVDIPRLLTSGYEGHAYVGHPFARDGWAQASGGAGYWLDRRAMEVVMDAPVTIAYEDTWVGQVLREAGIPLHHDTRYRVCNPHNFSDGPRPDNDAITAHLGFSPEPFDRRDMHAAHVQRWS